MGLFALLIACGGKAASIAGAGPIPETQQLFFAMAAGVLLGSRLGAVSAMVYLLAASITGILWPDAFGATPLIGSACGYLWALPLASYLAGYFVERRQSETPLHLAVGCCAAVAAFDLIGGLRLLASNGLDWEQSFGAGPTLVVLQHFAQGALAVWMGATASAAIQAGERK